ncbi:MAG: 2,3-bisphosphoglycerate-dependent phosphoglycerate mutase [Spirosomataceae bacterium]|jgi:broad specificity phosphatase PhoE
MKNLFILCMLLTISGCQTTYYVVRHAEKATEPRKDPVLTPEGEQRAERLKGIMLTKDIEKVFSSNYIRTKRTAQPTADALNLPVELYDPSNQDSFINALKGFNKNTLIVGHSNTIRYVVNGLLESDTLKQDLQDNEYSNLFIIKRKRFPKKVQVFEREEF